MMSLFLQSAKSRSFAIPTRQSVRNRSTIHHNKTKSLPLSSSLPSSPPSPLSSSSLRKYSFIQQKIDQSSKRAAIVPPSFQFPPFSSSSLQQQGQQQVSSFHSCVLRSSASSNNRSHIQSEENSNKGQKRYQNLLIESKTFLDNVENINSVEEKTREIVRLVHAWNNIWDKTSMSTSTSTVTTTTTIPTRGRQRRAAEVARQKSKSKQRQGQRQSSVSTTTDTDFAQNIEIVDQLVHLIMDVIEIKLKQKERITSSYSQIVDIALGGWSKAEPSSYSGARAQSILDRVEYIYYDLYSAPATTSFQNGVVPLRPSTASYGAVIKTWADSIDNDGEKNNGAQMAQMVLNRMEDLYAAGKNNLARPNLIVYNTCLHGYAQRGMIYEAEELITKLEGFCDYDKYKKTETNKSEKHSDDGRSLCPDVYTYSICMNAYQKFKGEIEGLPVEKRAENLLKKMIEKYERTGDVRVMPNQYTFGSVISIIVDGKSESRAADADKILHWLIELSEKQNLGNERHHSLEPTNGHFITVLKGYSRTKNKKLACTRIEELLVEMERLHEAGLPVKLTFKCFIIYLDTLIKTNSVDAETKANAVLSRMEKLYLNSKDSDFTMNNYGYNLVIDAISRSNKRGRAARAEAIIERMNELFRKTGNESLQPDKVTYTSLIKATIMDRDRGLASKCQSILKKMEDESCSNGDGNSSNLKMKPDLYTYASVLHALSYERHPEECEEFLDRMESLALAGDHEVFPNTICYNVVMSSYGKSRRGDAAFQTERILQKMIDSRNAGNKNLERNNTASYAICIDALARSNDPNRVDKAEALLQKLLGFHEKRKTHRNAPSTHIFNSMMFVYANSNLPDKAEMVLGVIGRMEEAGIRPDTVSYNTLLKACSKTNVNADVEVKRRAVDISKEAFRSMQQRVDIRPDAFTFNSLFWICHKMVDDPEEQVATIRALFERCCSDGQVDASVLNNLKRVAPPNLFLDLVGVHVDGSQTKFVEVQGLPKDWTRNINKRKKRK